MTTNHDLDQAREWAKDSSYQGDVPSVAAAEVIESLPDEWVDADKLREVIGRWDVLLADDDHEDMHGMLDDLRALFSAPKPRTLADLLTAGHAPEEYQWMKARLDDEVVVITNVNPSQAAYLRRSGTTGVRSASWFDQIVPLPDLQRMVWPEEQATEETPEQEQPQPEDVKPGEVWVVRCRDGQAVGMREDSEKQPWYVMWDDRDLQIKGLWLEDEDITLLHRLVPEQAPSHPERLVTEDTPEPAPTQPEYVKPDPQPGEAWLIEYEGKRYEAVYWYSQIYAHWAFVENRERGLKTVESPEATPVSRLVPERGDVS